MEYAKFRIRCPYCETDTLLVCVESSPIIYGCNCCGRFVVAQEKLIFTIRKEFFIKMSEKYDIKCCGQVVAHLCDGECKVAESKGKGKEITESDIQKLHELLIKAKDSSDIIENL